MVEGVDGAEDELEVALRVDVVEGLPGDLAYVAHVHVLIDDDEDLRRRDLAQAPEAVHHLAGVAGVALGQADQHQVMKDAFGRLSFDFTDNMNGYVQATWAQAGNESNWIQWVVSPSASRPNTLFANNPFLAQATQQQLGANITCGTPAAVQFALTAGRSEFIWTAKLPELIS